MKKIMFMFVFITLLFTTSFGYTLTIKNGDYTLKREGIMANTIMSFETTFVLYWNVLRGEVTPERIDLNSASFIMPSSDVEIEVKEFKYTIVYNGNGATSGSTASSEHIYGTSKALTANGFSRTGRVFVGWSTTASGDIKYLNKVKVLNLAENAEEIVNLYAVWGLDVSWANEQYLKITFPAKSMTIGGITVSTSNVNSWWVVSVSGSTIKAVGSASLASASGNTSSSLSTYLTTFNNLFSVSGAISSASPSWTWSYAFSDNTYNNVPNDYPKYGIYSVDSSYVSFWTTNRLNGGGYQLTPAKTALGSALSGYRLMTQITFDKSALYVKSGSGTYSSPYVCKILKTYQ